MNTILRIASAFAAGAAAMYYLDPVAGRRRRAIVRDKSAAATHGIEDFARSKSRHVSDRVHGVVAEARSAMARAPVGDQQLHDRIRSRLGRLVEHPDEISVDVQLGQVVLRGTATQDEIDDVLETVSTMRGVEGIDNHLVVASSDSGSAGSRYATIGYTESDSDSAMAGEGNRGTATATGTTTAPRPSL